MVFVLRSSISLSWREVFSSSNSFLNCLFSRSMEDSEIWMLTSIALILCGSGSFCSLEEVSSFLGHVHTYPEIFFSANIFLRIRKFTRPHAAYANRFQPSTRIRLYPEIFWFALVPSSFAGENPEMSMRINATLASFLPRHTTAECKQSKLVVYH